jgi:hypothetical protein
MPEVSLASPLLVVFAVLCMLCALLLLTAAVFGDVVLALIFAVGLVGSLVGLVGTGGRR